MPSKSAPALKPYKELKKVGLRVHPGFDSRNKHLLIQFEAPSQLNNNAVAFFYKDLKLGMYSYFRSGATRYLKAVGRYCSIGPNVTIADGEHPTNWLSTSPCQYGKRQFAFYAPDIEAALQRCVDRTSANNDTADGYCTIGHDVWIGGGATIQRGVNIGHGAIVAGNAFVTRDVPPYAIVAGLPAKIVRFRFDHDTITKLLNLRWWRFDINDFAGVPFDKIDTAISDIENRMQSGSITTKPLAYKQVRLHTKGYHDLSHAPEASDTPHPEADSDPLGLQMYLAHLRSQTTQKTLLSWAQVVSRFRRNTP